MKKLLLMSVITLMLGATSVHAKCEGGVEFQGAINGHTYCISSAPMTWWAAFAWCEFQGRELASMEQLCPNWGGGFGTNACPNMNAFSQEIPVWSANFFDTYGAVYVWPSKGEIHNSSMNTSRSRNGSLWAICY